MGFLRQAFAIILAIANPIMILLFDKLWNVKTLKR